MVKKTPPTQNSSYKVETMNVMRLVKRTFKVGTNAVRRVGRVARRTLGLKGRRAGRRTHKHRRHSRRR